jgi:hypothetical protein
MKTIASEIMILYDLALKKKGVPMSAHLYYKKLLRYHLDFCFKYHHEPKDTKYFFRN